MDVLHKISFWLLVIGGLNWLLYVLGWEVGGVLLGGMDAMLAQVVYVVVGLAALFEVFYFFKK
ncbi:MAG: DUF378 domain-containing protein [Parcubacteria group bacterium]|nr:DUF378 domain-containing protein [Parcubacteria group bacterium]